MYNSVFVFDNLNSTVEFTLPEDSTVKQKTLESEFQRNTLSTKYILTKSRNHKNKCSKHAATRYNATKFQWPRLDGWKSSLQYGHDTFKNETNVRQQNQRSSSRFRTLLKARALDAPYSYSRRSTAIKNCSSAL